VNRSNARDPVCAASAASPPTASAISRHSAVVLESIQIGDTGRASIAGTCDANVFAGFSDSSRAPESRFR
jgi:hypothetical protein